LVKNAEFEALLDKDLYQTQEEAAESLAIAQLTISVHLEIIGMIQKQGKWVP